MSAPTVEGRKSHLPTLEEFITYQGDGFDSKRTRLEADLMVRQLCDAYYQQWGLDNARGDGSQFDDFTRWLSWHVGGTCDREFLFDVVEAMDRLYAVYAGDLPHETKDHYQGELNIAVHEVLTCAGISGDMIRRYDDIPGVWTA